MNDSGPSTASRKVVLLVDRDPTFRLACAELLKAHAYKVEECDDARVALALALQQPFAVVVSAMHPRGFDGTELCRLLRRDASSKQTRTLLMLDSRKPQSSRVPADAVVAMPVSPSSVCDEVIRLTCLESRSNATPQPARAPGARRRIAEMRSRQTTQPPSRPPELRCRECGQPLTYNFSHLSGANVMRPDQWDFYTCPTGCGTFQWRHQARQLISVSRDAH